MTPQTFSLEMCRLLSSLAPEFEGHWAYVESLIDGKIQIVCAFKRQSWRWANDYKFICPAWQAEDLLRNIFKITENFKEKGIRKDGELLFINDIIHEISCFLSFNDFETAYLKIEEYLWSVIK